MRRRPGGDGLDQPHSPGHQGDKRSKHPGGERWPEHQHPKGRSTGLGQHTCQRHQRQIGEDRKRLHCVERTGDDGQGPEVCRAIHQDIDPEVSTPTAYSMARVVSCHAATADDEDRGHRHKGELERDIPRCGWLQQQDERC